MDGMATGKPAGAKDPCVNNDTYAEAASPCEGAASDAAGMAAWDEGAEGAGEATAGGGSNAAAAAAGAAAVPSAILLSAATSFARDTRAGGGSIVGAGCGGACDCAGDCDTSSSSLAAGRGGE